MPRGFAALVVSLLAATNAIGQPNTWSPTGPMAFARYSHTATLLLDGTVLVAGGRPATSLDTAEVYDPSSGSWTTTGTLANGRTGHTATRLLDGRVLVVGGAGSTGYLSSAELYDPATGGWSLTTGMSVARGGHTATLLPDGRVLVAGGNNLTSFGSLELFLASAEMYDPATGTWSPTGNMTTGRLDHTAILLPDGHVIAVGGFATYHSGTGYNATKLVDLYNPSTGLWTSTGDLKRDRIWSTATLLADGRVLAAGSGGSSPPAFASELWNPATGAWSLTTSMTVNRWRHVEARIADGRPIVAGGFKDAPVPNHQGISTTTAEAFDPLTGTWSSIADMNTPRAFHTLTALPDGRVLVAGGYNERRFLGGSTALSSAELYTPALVLPSVSIANRTVSEGDAGTTQAVFTVTLSAPSLSVVTVDFATADGSAAAGSDYAASAGTLTIDPGEVSGEIEIEVHGDFDLEANEAFTVSLANAVNATIGDAAGVGTIVNDDLPPPSLSINDVTITEGNAGTTSVTFTVTVSSPRPYPITVDFMTGGGSAGAPSDYVSRTGTLTFEPAEPTEQIVITVNGDVSIEPHETFVVSLSNASNATIGDGIGIGTIVSDDLPTLSIDDVTVPEGSWGSMTTPRSSHTATLLQDGRVVAAGRGAAEVYDPSTGAWSSAGNMSATRFVHTATLLTDGKLLVAGGWNFSATAYASSEIFDPSLGAWLVSGSMSQARWDHTATLLPNGKVLVTGGTALIGGIATPLASAELYDPSTGTWSNASNMATARTNHTATRISGGRILVAGGAGAVAPAEVYDLSTDTWSPAGTLLQGRAGHAAALLPSGKVLVTGGYSNTSALTSAELYDPFANTWSSTGNMSHARYWFSNAWVLPTGHVLVAGSWGAGGAASAELYDPSSGLWSPTGSMSQGRGAHRTTQLLDGRVLVTGGRKTNTTLPLASAELYNASTGVWSPAGAVNATFTVTLSPASPLATTVDFAAADATATAGSDYAAGTGTLTFSPGETTRTISMLVYADLSVEPDETFLVNLTNPTNATISDGQGIGTISNNDFPPVSLPPVATPIGSDVEVSLPPVSLTFDSVTSAGQTDATITTSGPPPPSGFQLGDPPTYIDLSTTATFAGSIEVCINYSGVSIFNEAAIRLFHFASGAWTDITTSVDTIADVICGETTSLSPFALLEPSESIAPAFILTLPGDISREAVGPAGAPVGFVASAVHEILGPLPVGCSPSPGSMFPIGTTTVNCSATDGAGNTATGSFQVSVRVGAPRLSARLLSTTPRTPGGDVTAMLEVKNLGDGVALDTTIDRLTFKTLAGSGAVSAITAIPIAIGLLAPGESRTIAITVNVPVTVSRFSMTEGGRLKRASGVFYRFSMSQAIRP